MRNGSSKRRASSPLTEKELAQRRAAARKPKVGLARGGRPPTRTPARTKPSYVNRGPNGKGPRLRTYIEGTPAGDWLSAKRACEDFTPELVAFWISVVRGELAGFDSSDRVRCAENLADRGKLVRQSALNIHDDSKPTLVEPARYRDSEGKFHDVDVTGPPETAETPQ